MQTEIWVPILSSAATLIIGGYFGDRRARRMQKTQEKSTEFEQMQGVAAEYQQLYKLAVDRQNTLESRLSKMEGQQLQNTINISELKLKEQECQKTVSLLSGQLNHLTDQNKQMLKFLTDNEKR